MSRTAIVLAGVLAGAVAVCVGLGASLSIEVLVASGHDGAGAAGLDGDGRWPALACALTIVVASTGLLAALAARANPQAIGL
ncbi:hypothetical protein ASE14_12225 [Agromyces sp. Root81]|uniref:hypothetical protein n=1 Tax=Agromyces sp. Root81 TaxID=1736601 RepID=UPI0006FC76F0|nr:hypothetical protein [Agromyces sp. Root81]KRC61603.1 hypothetical protein ASE14_12225 [Agromyces sp. Root81]